MRSKYNRYNVSNIDNQLITGSWFKIARKECGRVQHYEKEDFVRFLK